MKKPGAEFIKFHNLTKNVKPIKEISFKNYPDSWLKVDFKGYARFKEIKLPKPKALKQKLNEVLINRKSTRIFSNKKIDLDKISTLLYYSAGLRDNKPPWTASRFYPSAGSRYPLEIYVLSIKSALNSGLYHYYLKNHSLEELLLIENLRLNEYFIQSFVKKASFIILITSVFPRTTSKYGNRGYRHVLVETGHLSQNFYLTASALGLKVCSVAGFFDDKLNRLLDLDGVEESVVGALVFGS